MSEILGGIQLAELPGPLQLGSKKKTGRKNMKDKPAKVNSQRVHLQNKDTQNYRLTVTLARGHKIHHDGRAIMRY